jgi:Ca2+-binding RTX toxin-like protein
MALAVMAIAIALLAFLAHAAPASSEGQIVIGGADSGTHLRLSVLGDNLVVHGPMELFTPQGCRFTVGHNVAVCPLLGNSSVRIVTGPADDKVEVLDRLPVPLIAYLGKGSDKLIGNGERDTCYPQGSRRNRCIGGAGNDVCITGPRNSDCVGGPGDDYCKTSTGSDGCWGGPGNDVCYMGPGHDGCHGDAGNDRLYGGSDSDQLYGGAGADLCDGGPGVGYSHECESGRRH